MKLGTVLTWSHWDWAQYWPRASKIGHSIDQKPMRLGTVLTKTEHSIDQEPMILGTVLTKSQEDQAQYWALARSQWFRHSIDQDWAQYWPGAHENGHNILTRSQQDWAQYWPEANKIGHNIDQKPTRLGTILTRSHRSHQVIWLKMRLGCKSTFRSIKWLSSHEGGLKQVNCTYTSAAVYCIACQNPGIITTNAFSQIIFFGGGGGGEREKGTVNQDLARQWTTVQSN